MESDDEASQQAKAHRDKLLNYQANNARRTQIHDEAADYDIPTTGTNMWASPAERAQQLKKQQKMLREMEWSARPDYEKRRMVELLESQLLRSDVVLVAGTFAGGGDDLLQEALAELGDMSFTQVAMHPGPLHAFGLLGPEQVPVICIPGEPVAALVAFEVFVRPVIRLMLGKKQLFRRTVQAVSAQQLLSPLGYRQYLHGQVMRHPDGGYIVEPIGDGDQAMLARMAKANCLIVVDEDVTEVSAGGLVTVMPMLLGG